MPEYNCQMEGDAAGTTHAKVTADDKIQATGRYMELMTRQGKAPKRPFGVKCWEDGENFENAKSIRFPPITVPPQ
ncbi:MAG TPA: hypothetical protein VII08_10870 [Myxococcales bacterium]